MTTLTQEAQKRLQEYLRQVHAALSGCQSVSADEVERDIRDHIEREFQTNPDVVSLGQLDPVLARLGSPDQWVPQEEPPWWRLFLSRLRSGPEDWRLAYLAFALLLLGGTFPSKLWFLIPASYLVSRAGLAAARERNQALGAQKWFLYPSLIVVGVGLLLVLLFGPLLLSALFGEYLWLHHRDGSISGATKLLEPVFWQKTEFVAFVMVGATASWWFVLGGILCIWPRITQAVCPPLAEMLGGKLAKVILYVSLGLGILCGIVVALGLLL